MNKLEVIKEIHQLKKEVLFLEREKTNQVYRECGKFSSQLTEIDSNYSKTLLNDKMHLLHELKKSRLLVEKLKKELSKVKSAPLSLEKLKILMEEIENNISTLKARQKLGYEELFHEEQILSREVLAMDSRITSWDNKIVNIPPQNNLVSSTLKAAAPNISDNLPPEVAQFERFIQKTGGIRGGWDDYDHGTFLKFRNSNKNKPTFITELALSLPTKTDSEIYDHEIWYQKYLTLNDIKKNAIQKWKEKREIEKAEIIRKTENETKVNEKRTSKSVKESMKSKQLEKLHQLNSWKLDREIRLADEKQKEEDLKLLEKEKNKVKRQKQIELKEKVDAYKQMKIIHKREEELAEQLKKNYQSENTGNLTLLHERDMKKISEKKARESDRQKTEALKLEKLNRLKKPIDIEHDPSRLYKPTIGWENRMKSSEESKSETSITTIPHRAIPVWRQLDL